MARAVCVFVIESEVTRGEPRDRHEHACTEIVLTGATTGRVSHRAEWRDFAEDQLIVHPPLGAHSVEARRPGAQLGVGVAGCGAASLRFEITHASDQARGLMMQIADVATYARGRWCYREQRLDLLAGLLITELAEAQDGARRAVEPPSYAQAAKDALDTRFAEPIDPAAIAAELRISSDYLRQLFRKAYGTSPSAYLAERRVEAASKLLAQSDLSVQDIAAQCGFDDPFYFSRAFRKATGRSPSAYRAAHRSE